jgi:uncharacterized membrane protein YcaP (DUF421 family)
MESVIRAICIYLFLMLVIRISGHRTLKELTTFDFVLLLIVGDASQQAMTGTDYSLTNGFIIIVSLVTLDICMSYLKQKFPLFEKIVDGTPLILINQGKIQTSNMDKAQIDKSDILESARKCHGLERMEQIKYAILEKNGEITIIPYE